MNSGNVSVSTVELTRVKLIERVLSAGCCVNFSSVVSENRPTLFCSTVLMTSTFFFGRLVHLSTFKLSLIQSG